MCNVNRFTPVANQFLFFQNVFLTHMTFKNIHSTAMFNNTYLSTSNFNLIILCKKCKKINVSIKSAKILKYMQAIKQ